MAATITAIPAADLTYRTANKPQVVGRNVLEKSYAVAAANLVANTAGTIAAGDASDATFHRRFLTSRDPGQLWKFGSSVTDMYLVMDTGVDDGSKDVDTLVVQGHNFDANVTITVEADPTTPAVPWVGATSAFSLTPVSGVLVYQLHAASMHKARYWRIRIQRTGAFIAQASQIWLGKAIQFPVKSIYDYSPEQATVADWTSKKTRGGTMRRSRNHGSLQSRAQVFEIPDAPEGAFLGTDLKDCWDNADSLNGGGNSFWYCENPTTAPSSAKFVYSVPTRFDVNQVGPFVSRFRLETMEQGGGS